MNGFQTGAALCVSYCVISAICAVSLIYFIVVTDRSAEHSPELLFYKLTMGLAALCSATDILYALRTFGAVSFHSGVSYLGEILYSLGSICGAYGWFLYSEMKQQSCVSRSVRLRYLCAAPFTVMVLFTLTTPLHGRFFSLSGAAYVRGSLYVPFTAVCSVFVVVTGVRALLRSFRKRYHSRSVMLRLLFAYSLVLTGAQILQVVAGSILPFRSLFAAVVFQFITLRGMCETVTIDAVAHINNRFALDRTLDGKLQSGERFWLLLLDIDNFKRVNDTFGHLLGDEAIRHTASAIVRAVPRNYFAARYGGDEFAVVAPFDDEPTVTGLEEKIREELRRVVRENRCPFRLDITAGYARRDERVNNIPDLIEAADRMLYERKSGKKRR